MNAQPSQWGLTRDIHSSLFPLRTAGLGMTGKAVAHKQNQALENLAAKHKHYAQADHIIMYLCLIQAPQYTLKSWETIWSCLLVSNVITVFKHLCRPFTLGSKQGFTHELGKKPLFWVCMSFPWKKKELQWMLLSSNFIGITFITKVLVLFITLYVRVLSMVSSTERSERVQLGVFLYCTSHQEVSGSPFSSSIKSPVWKQSGGFPGGAGVPW